MLAFTLGSRMDLHAQPHLERPFTRVASQTAFRCPYYTVRKDELVTADGHEATYYVVDLIGGVWIVPVTRTGEIVLIRNYRYPVDAWCWELPAGGLQPSDEPLELAREELKEETGGVAQRWTFLGNFFSKPSMSTEVAHIFLATGVELGEAHPEPSEFMEIHPMPAEQVYKLARSNQIGDARSALALFMFEERIRQACLAAC
jgi:ADP-ribose pyrophosphatase